MSLNLRQVIADELRRLGADAVRIDENGRGKHPYIVGRFGTRVLTIPAPRGTPAKDRGDIRAVYRTKTRRAVRDLMAQTQEQRGIV